jgi:antitoxin (DNA-binding transcriptional repressor) of toxin-antitoxin stability system
MSRSITATALRQELRDILADLDAGPVEITKHGTVVAVLSRPIPADLLEEADPAVVCPTDESAPPCDTCTDAPASGVEQHADQMRSRGALAVDASDGSQEPSGEPVEASEGVDTSEPVSASQEATEAEEGSARLLVGNPPYQDNSGSEKTRFHSIVADPPYQGISEAEEPNDFTEEDDRDLEAEFDAWLAAGQPDEPPSYYPEDEVFLR